MPDKVDKTKSPRKSARLHHELLVGYRTVSGFITDWAVNISRGGIFINTPKPLPVGNTVSLNIALPDNAFPFVLTGKVVRVTEAGSNSGETAGMAVEFIDVDEEKLARIEGFVEKLRKELPEMPRSRK
ncbi:MAG: TIGR02266 family protein [Myxococcaceae bacterium]|nr:TIGR02266 family protein [Myxococcaceae bacterium]